MEGLTKVAGDLGQWWVHNGATVVLWSMVGVAAFIVGSLLWARRKGFLPRWLSTVANLLVLALSSEGMWEFLHDLLKLPPQIAFGTFVVGDLMLLTSMRHARDYYHATTQWVGEGEHRTIAKYGHTGRHGRTVWIIATVLGAIVATGADRWEEIPFRLALPLGAALMWHTELTAAGIGEAERSSWRWTPRRLFVWLGAIEPGERDLSDVHNDYAQKALTRAAFRRHATRWEWLRHRRDRRLARLSLDATSEQMAVAAAQVQQAHNAVQMTSPKINAVVDAAVAEVQQDAAAALTAAQEDASRQLAELERQWQATEAELKRELAAAREAAEAAQQQAQQVAEREIGQARDEAQAAMKAQQEEAGRTARALAAERDRVEQAFRADLQRLTTASQDRDREQSAAVERWQQQATQHAQQVAEWQARAERLDAELARLRPLPGQVAQLTGELERSRSEAEQTQRDLAAARKQLAARPAPAAATQPKGSGWRPATESERKKSAPVMTGTSALAPRADAAPIPQPRGPRGIKGRVFELLDGWQPDPDAVSTGEVASRVVAEVEAVTKTDTAAKYYREWQSDVVRKKRVLPPREGRRLRAVPATQDH